MGAVLAAIWVKIPLWVKVTLAVAIAVVFAYQAGLWIGARDERSAAKMDAIKEAANSLAIVALSSCAIAGCQTAPTTDGSGYQLTRFSDPAAARAAAEDPTAGPAIGSNNQQCRSDRACRK